MKLIKERVELINSGHNLPPLVIFPEGTTTNGRQLISFKKGAFENLDPVLLAPLKYDERYFNLSMDYLGLELVSVFALL